MVFVAFILGICLGLAALLQKSSVRESAKTAVFLLNTCLIVAYNAYYNLSEWQDLVLSLLTTFSAYWLVVNVFVPRQREP